MWDKPTFERISAHIDQLEPEMVELQKSLVALPALSPKSGGEGEKAKAEFMKKLLEGWGLEVTEYRAPDRNAPCGYRPSLVARLKGRTDRPTLWIMTHLDIVPPGPRELWTHDPYQAVVRDGKVYGRGTEDNQQEMVASAFAVKAMLDLDLVPNMDVCLMLVADEETGSVLGVDWLLKNHELCRADDLVIVPDAGNKTGTMLEIAEKSIAWVKFLTTGRQVHASVPQDGNNALRAGAHLLVRLDNMLHERYADEDPLFSPPKSTMEPTRKTENVPNVNTIPGEDVFWFDCRMLPKYGLDDLLHDMNMACAEIEFDYRVQVELETGQMVQAPKPTPKDAPVVRMLGQAVKAVHGAEPFTKGIGGGTVASFFRRRGIPAVVWNKSEGKAHNPNEFSVIANMVADCKVYAHVFGQELQGS
jgi:succinyl-diaminopimelate desuccinylase